MLDFPMSLYVDGYEEELRDLDDAEIGEYRDYLTTDDVDKFEKILDILFPNTFMWRDDLLSIKWIPLIDHYNKLTGTDFIDVFIGLAEEYNVPNPVDFSEQ